MVITKTNNISAQKNNFGQLKIRGKGWTPNELHAVTNAYGKISDAAKGKADVDLVREKIGNTIYHRTLASTETKSFVGRIKKFLTGETDLNTPPRGRLLSRGGIVRQTAQKLLGLDPIILHSKGYSEHELHDSKNLQDWFVKSSEASIDELGLVVANSEKTRTTELKAEIKKHQ